MGRLFLTACEIKFTSRDALHRTLHLWSLSLFCYKLHLSQLRSRNEILGSHLKVNFKKCDLRSLYRDYRCSVTTLKKEINTFVCLDCVASVFNWVITRKLERERKKNPRWRGWGWGWGWGEEKTAFPSLPSFPPSFLLFVIASTFSTNPLGNACYAGYRVPSFLFFLLAVAMRNPMSFDILVRLGYDFVSVKDS